MPDPRQLAVEALENVGWDADKARQIVADLAEAGVLPSHTSWTSQGEDPEPWIAQLNEYTREEAEDYVRYHGGHLVCRHETDWTEVMDG